MVVLFRLSAVVAGLLVFAGTANAQTAQSVPSAEPLLSPGAAYQEAVHPVEVTRRSIANWSTIEQAALAVAVKQGSAACAARKVEDYAGEALIDLAHLCALGLDWPKVVAAADGYLEEKIATKPRLEDAYASKIDALLHVKDEAGALKTAEMMLGALPYDVAVADTTSEALNYMELLFTADALALAEERFPVVLELLKSSGGDASLKTAIRPSELYRQALEVAELQQLMNEATAADETYASINGAVPAGVPGDDAIAIAGMRRRYELLGKPLGKVGAIASLDVVSRIPELPARRAMTAMLLFPDWCAQCIRLAKQMPESVFNVQGHEAYLYGLLAQTVAAAKPERGQKAGITPESFDPAYAAEYLRGTPSLTVPVGLLETFDATEVPLLIVVDRQGVVRLIDGVDEDALQPGKTVDSAIALVGKTWPGAVKENGSKTGTVPKVH